MSSQGGLAHVAADGACGVHPGGCHACAKYASTDQCPQDLQACYASDAC